MFYLCDWRLKDRPRPSLYNTSSKDIVNTFDGKYDGCLCETDMQRIR